MSGHFAKEFLRGGKMLVNQNDSGQLVNAKIGDVHHNAAKNGLSCETTTMRLRIEEGEYIFVNETKASTGELPQHIDAIAASITPFDFASLSCSEIT
jgi:hypothetical protein